MALVIILDEVKKKEDERYAKMELESAKIAKYSGFYSFFIWQYMYQFVYL